MRQQKLRGKYAVQVSLAYVGGANGKCLMISILACLRIDFKRFVVDCVIICNFFQSKDDKVGISFNGDVDNWNDVQFC